MNFQLRSTTTQTGVTLDACNYQVVGLPGQASALDRKEAPKVNYVYQVNQARVGTTGQQVNWYLNNRSPYVTPDQATPWIWSVIQLDTNGHFNPSAPQGGSPIFQIFPTYNIYVNGFLSQTITQSALGSFTVLDAGSSSPTSRGPVRRNKCARFKCRCPHS